MNKSKSAEDYMKNILILYRRNGAVRSVDIADEMGVTRPSVCNASMDEVISAAKKACCHDFIMTLPEGYETVIGENGASLSGGER